MLAKPMEPGSANVTEPAWRGRLVSVLGCLVIAHVLFGVGRIPHAVIAQRWEDVDGYRRDGDAAWLFREAKLEGADAIAAVRARTAPDAVVLFRGDRKGAMEWAPPLLWPRLCCAEERLPAGAKTFAGRPIADLVLVGDENLLRVEAR
jgi:hypothetical protein